MKKVLLIFLLMIPFLGISQKIGAGVSLKGEVLLSNPYFHKLRIETKSLYLEKTFNYDHYKLLSLNVSCEYKWLQKRRLNVASGASIPIKFVYLEFPMHDGVMERDLEVIFFFDFIPLSVEYFPFSNAQNLSIFTGTRFRYTYLNTTEGFAGIRQYF